MGLQHMNLGDTIQPIMLRLLLSLPKPYFLIYKMGIIYLTRRTIGMIIKEPVKHLSQFLTLRRYTVVSGGYYQYFRPSLKEHGVPCTIHVPDGHSGELALRYPADFGQGKGAFSASTSLVLAEEAHHQISQVAGMCPQKLCSLSLVIPRIQMPILY